MKKLLLFILFISPFYTAHAQQAKSFFDTLQYDFGVMQQGDTAEHYFYFTNSSATELVITEVKTTCSCTASEYPQNPVKPGEKAFIKVAFDTHDKEGQYAKGINLYTNMGEINLIIFAQVHAKR